ncbi:unnamed protein product [Adineta steineri]|uniref:BAT2 N-terminal domain-containing protein n=2 Tax=Adineta steineri TaxID=433720 RepID=A0A813UDA6_9BILA|nr:unnamed protein product [Adineta steineri]CAF0827456.1 unnamed protein product [Adineta steineri]
MSVPNKSLDKNKRYAGVKANDFVNKTRASEANRSAVRPQGWANLGKINNRRIPPPANLPSLKSETGVNSPAFDPTITTNHGWTSNENSTSMNSVPNPTQQQLDSLPVNSPTPPPPPLLQSSSSIDADKTRNPPTWSTITAGTNPTSTGPAPSLLGLNDFPRLATTTTTEDRKSQSESLTNISNPTFRPTNLAIWKEGGGSRVQSLSNDIPQNMPNNPGANFYQQQMPNVRMYPPQMWAYAPYPQMPLTMHQQQQQQPPPRVHTLNDYKSPTILRNKDIDDLSKITDNTWANAASQEVNYEEKIRFSDDEDEHNRREIIDSNNKPRRMKPQILQHHHPRLIQDDEHLKQMQDNKNSELINALTIAKKRREEQERHLRNEHLISNIDEQKQIPGYQTRPLLTSNEQENYNSSSPLWQANRDTTRTRHDTANSQSSFTMKSWSDQMDSFNYTSLHEKSGGSHLENEEPSTANKYSRSQSGSSSQSQHDKEPVIRKTKKLLLLPSKKQQQKTNSIQTKNSLKKSNKVDSTDYYDNSNDQWDNWDESTDNHQRHRQQLHSDDLSTQKPNRYNKQPTSTIKTRNNDRQQTNSRFKQNSSTLNKTNDNKTTTNNNKTQPVWRPLSPNRPTEAIDPTPQESMIYKSQQQQQQQINDPRRQSESYQQRTNINDHKQQRYQTINTASIPPLMSVRSDVNTTAKLYKTANHTNSSHYEDENMYYDSNLQTHQRYNHSNAHNRGYTTLGSYGRYRRSGTVRHQQQYTTYNTNNTSGISSAPTTNNGARQKKNPTNRTNTNNKKTSQSSEQTKPTVIDETNSSLEKLKITNEEVPMKKPNETAVLTPTTEVLPKEIGKSNDSGNGISDEKVAIKNDNETNVVQTENESTKINKKTTTTTPSSANTKRRTNKDQQNYHQDQRYQNQQAPRHRNNYARAMQEYDTMQMSGTHNYYGSVRRAAHGGGGRNSHTHDLSSNYYYEHPQQHYNNRYNYSNEHYQQQRPTNNKNSKRGGASIVQNQQQRQPIVNGSGGGGGSNNNNNNNFRHHSISDNDQKEGEEWETASESSTNMRNGHYDNNGINNQQTNETKSVNRGRTPPKKSFSSQRPNARQIFKYTNA